MATANELTITFDGIDLDALDKAAQSVGWSSVLIQEVMNTQVNMNCRDVITKPCLLMLAIKTESLMLYC